MAGDMRRRGVEDAEADQEKAREQRLRDGEVEDEEVTDAPPLHDNSEGEKKKPGTGETNRIDTVQQAAVHREGLRVEEVDLADLRQDEFKTEVIQLLREIYEKVVEGGGPRLG